MSEPTDQDAGTPRACHCSAAFEWRSIRLSVYALLIVSGGWLLLQRSLQFSQEAYDGGELSAFAWTGFWPFVFPMFWAEAAIYIVPVALFVEVVLWIGRMFRGHRK